MTLRSESTAFYYPSAYYQTHMGFSTTVKRRGKWEGQTVYRKYTFHFNGNGNFSKVTYEVEISKGINNDEVTSEQYSTDEVDDEVPEDVVTEAADRMLAAAEEL